MRTNGNGGKNYIVVFFCGVLLVCFLIMNSFFWLVGFVNCLPTSLLAGEYDSVRPTFWRSTDTTEKRLGAAQILPDSVSHADSTHHHVVPHGHSAALRTCARTHRVSPYVI